MNRNSVQLLILFLVFAIVAGCASRQVRSDYDPSVDFSQFQTYNFFEEAGPRDSDYKSFFSQYMIAAISREMDARGYTRSDEPDLLINFNGVLQEKTRVSTSTVPSMDIGMGWGSYYGYRSGFYDPWFDGYETRTHISEYTEGTFNIDLVDAKRKKLVWEVIGVSNVSQQDLADLEKSVNRGVAAYFAEYPFKASDD
jgi:hypothetical protein